MPNRPHEALKFPDRFEGRRVDEHRTDLDDLHLALGHPPAVVAGRLEVDDQIVAPIHVSRVHACYHAAKAETVPGQESGQGSSQPGAFDWAAFVDQLIAERGSLAQAAQYLAERRNFAE